jgi:hypothetical protein
VVIANRDVPARVSFAAREAIVNVLPLLVNCSRLGVVGGLDWHGVVNCMEFERFGGVRLKAQASRGHGELRACVRSLSDSSLTD